MFSAVDGFRATSNINVADGYISTFNSGVQIYTVIPTSDGNTLYIGGTCVPPGQSTNDLLWMKVNNQNAARISIEKQLGNASNPDSGLLMALDSSENVYTVGQGYYTSSNTPAIATKYTSTGTLTWQKEYADTGQADVSATFNDIAVESGGGNIYCSGSTNQLIGGTYTSIPVLVKYNSSGTVQYQEETSYANSGSLIYNFSRINDLTVGLGNRLYMAGDIVTYDFGNTTFYTSGALQKRYANGVVEWDYTSSSSNANIIFRQSVVDSSNNVFVTGYYENANGNFITKLYANGVVDWQTEYVDTSITSIGLDDTGNLYMAGRLSPSFNDAFYISIDTSTGNINSQTFINRSTGNLFIADINYANNFVYLGGYTQGYTGVYNSFTMKLPSNGNVSGTYGEFSFSTANIVENSITLPGGGGNLDFSTVTYGEATASLTDTNGVVGRRIIPL